MKRELAIGKITCYGTEEVNLDYFFCNYSAVLRLHAA